MPPPDDIADTSPDDGITRIAIPKPFSDWGTPVVSLAVIVNVVTGTYLRSRLFFQSATTFEQIAIALACLLATSLPFVVAYGLWRLWRRRQNRAARPPDAETSFAAAAESCFRTMSLADIWARCRAFTSWAQERHPDTRVFVIHWRDEVAAIDPVKTPFEPRLIESDDPLPDASDSSNNSGAMDAGLDGGIPGSSNTVGSKRSRKTIAILGMVMIAASIVWVAAGLAQSPRIQWMTDMLFPLTVTVLAGITILGLRGWLIRERWLLVPGGVVVRRSSGARASVENLLFDRRKSVACVFELADADWLVTLRSGPLLAQRRMNPTLLTRFLRTWLSPIPPPVERMVDFE